MQIAAQQRPFDWTGANVVRSRFRLIVSREAAAGQHDRSFVRRSPERSLRDRLEFCFCCCCCHHLRHAIEVVKVKPYNGDKRKLMVAEPAHLR